MKLEFSIGGSDQKEEINAILPLFTPKDQELAPLINTQLYRLVLSYIITMNPDAYFTEAYMSLLANTLVYLLGEEEKSEWRDRLLDDIYSTIELTYKSDPNFKQYNK